MIGRAGRGDGAQANNQQIDGGSTSTYVGVPLHGLYTQQRGGTMSVRRCDSDEMELLAAPSDTSIFVGGGSWLWLGSDELLASRLLPGDICLLYTSPSPRDRG